jgi:hypothetical protein
MWSHVRNTGLTGLAHAGLLAAVADLRWRERTLWFATGLGAACVLLLARALHPNPAGLGTHTQLGLPPCGFLSLTGVPCPGCGLTTSFVHLMHGELVQAALANPLGVPLCLGLLASVPVSGWGLWRGASVADVCRRVGLSALVGVWCGGLFAAWCTRMFVVVLS